MKFDMLCERLGARSARKRRALKYVVRAWQSDTTLAFIPRDDAAIELKRLAREDYEADCEARRKKAGNGDGPYGFVIIASIALIIFAAAIGWATEKLLDWWWDRRGRKLEIEFDEKGDERFDEDGDA